MALRWSIGQTFLVLVILASAHAKYKMCQLEASKEDCKALQIGNSYVSCELVQDSTGCAQKLSYGSADFAVLTPDAAVLASYKIDNDVQVIGELRHEDNSQDAFSYQAVVVVRKTAYNNNFNDLRGKGYCHPGFGPGQHFSDRILKHFERTVVQPKCVSYQTSAEDEISGLNDFFGDSCRPGPWVRNANYDQRLKRRYTNLCARCDVDCNHTLRKSAHTSTLHCLTERSGDVAFTGYQDMRKYFGLEPGSQRVADPRDYALLCEDRTTKSLDTSEPCTWARQPWDLVVARTEKASEVQGKLSQWLSQSGSTPETWITELKRMMRVGNSFNFVNTTITSLSQYLDRGVDKDSSDCVHKRVKWCVIGNDERQKCEWLSKSANVLGITPKFECSQGKDLWDCFNKINARSADVIAIDSENGYLARKAYNLTPVVYQDSELAAYFKIITVIKDSATGDIKSLKDLKNKKACFPEYGGLGWISFLKVFRDQKVMGKQCSTFFSGGCVPGANDPTHTIGGDTLPDSMCQCSNGTAKCTTDSSNPFYGDLGALRCLETSGDVAFVDYSHIKKELKYDVKVQGKRVLCRNGTIFSFDRQLEIDDYCALAVGNGGEVVSRPDGQVELTDRIELFLELNEWFGTTGHGKHRLMYMFDRFNGTSGLLFKSSTVFLVDPDNRNYEYINSYKNLLNKVEGCSTASSISAMSTFTLASLSLFISYMLSLKW